MAVTCTKINIYYIRTIVIIATANYIWNIVIIRVCTICVVTITTVILSTRLRLNNIIRVVIAAIINIISLSYTLVITWIITWNKQALLDWCFLMRRWLISLLSCTICLLNLLIFIMVFNFFFKFLLTILENC